MRLCLLLLLFPLLLLAEDPLLKTKLSSLDPLSVAQHLAFYELYPQAEEGKKALNHAWLLLSGGKAKEVSLPTVNVQEIIHLVSRQNFQKKVKLTQEQLDT